MSGYLLIGNPNAGGFTDALFRRVKCFLEDHGKKVVPFSDLASEGGNCRKKLLSTQWDAAVVVGGDGTINRVVNFLGPGLLTIGVIPAGTGNVVARELGLPMGDPDEAAEAVLRGDKRTVDLGVLNDRYFLLMAGVGFDGYVAMQLPVHKRTLGMWSYVLAAVKAYLRFKPRSIVVKTGQVAVKGETVLICNARIYGGPLCFACDAEMDDGFLDMIVFRKMTIARVFKYLLMGSGLMSLDLSGDVFYSKIKNAEIYSFSPVPVQTDGESYGKTPVTVQILPAAQDFFVPRT